MSSSLTLTISCCGNVGAIIRIALSVVVVVVVVVVSGR
jgi:hypothetical protein